MAIKRGGGSEGPQGPRVPRSPTDPRVQLDKAHSVEDAKAEDAKAVSLEADSFEEEMSAPGVTRSATGDRLEDALLRPEQRPSSLKSTERLLTTTYDRLAKEYAAAQAEARQIVVGLADEGFRAAAVEAAAPRLREQRARISKIRARLSNIHRRLRTIAVPAGRAGELQLEGRVGEQLRAVTRLERGAERSLMALQLATTFRPRAADGRALDVARVNVSGAAERAQLGSELARLAPDAASTDAMLRLLAAESSGATGSGALEGAPTQDLRSLGAFFDAQHGT